MSGPVRARCLDITRLASRAGRPLTGVDRVELAYARAIAADDVPAFGLCKTRWGYLLLDTAGLAAFAEDRGDVRRVRSLARWRCTRLGLGRLLRRVLPPGSAYLNVGHSNLTARVCAAVRRVPGSRIGVFIHDLIPLEWPEFQRDGTVERFEAFLVRAVGEADLLITNSDDTAAKLAAHAPDRRGDIVAAHLGVDPLSVSKTETNTGKPYVICVGTIEPRKNHAMLLDVWATLGPDAPELWIVGARGWNNDAVFARLDASPAGVRELGSVSDEEMANLVAGARAMVFPSLAEGFGLPPAEALMLGTPVLCSDLPVLREFLGEFPVYLDPDDSYVWAKEIKRLQAEPASHAGRQGHHSAPFVPPSWADHFKKVLAKT